VKAVEAAMLRVQRQQCATCIFMSTVWSEEHLGALLDEVRDPAMHGHFRGYRICHYSPNAVCAGFWARYRDHFDLGQLAQRLKFVAFVDDREEDARRRRTPRVQSSLTGGQIK
jgi:hypothetical protein